MLNHINTQHPEATCSKEKMRTKSVSQYLWLDPNVVRRLRPFDFVEDPLIREYIKLDPISTETLQKYMSLLTKQVETKIAKLLPHKITLIFDS